MLAQVNKIHLYIILTKIGLCNRKFHWNPWDKLECQLCYVRVKVALLGQEGGWHSVELGLVVQPLGMALTSIW